MKTRRTTLLSISIALALLSSACSEQAASTKAVTADEDSPAAFAEGQTYRVKGIITQLPSDGPPPKELKIHHEHIPNFIGKSGEVFVNSNGVSGMRAMNMAFPNLVASIPLDSFAVSDKVEFVFVVRWDEDEAGNRSPRWLVTELSRLPEDAVISHENKPAP